MAMQGLDPTCIVDIERSARHLATSVDEMVENLSGLLQGKSACYSKYLQIYPFPMDRNGSFDRLQIQSSWPR